MTTKETFDFNLQLFAVPTVATIGASGSNVSIGGSEVVSRDVDSSITSAESTILAALDSNTTITSIDGIQYTRASTDATDANSDTWNYTVTYYDTDTYTFESNTAGYSIASGTASVGATVQTTISSGSSVNGGGLSSDNLVLDGIGTISGFESDEVIVLGASSGDLSINSISGGSNGIALSLEDSVFSGNVNGAALNFSAGSVLLNNDKTNLDIYVSNSASLGAINANQTWYLDANESLSYGGVTYTAGTGGATITDANSNGYLDITGANVAVSGSATVEYYGSTIKGATGSLAYANSTTTVNSASAQLAEGGANVTANSNGITSIDSLAANGRWVLSSVTAATLGSESFAFANTNATIVADSNGTAASTVNGHSGHVTLKSVATGTPLDTSTDGLTVNGKKWTVVGANASEEAVDFDANGNVVYSGSVGTLRSASAASVTSGSGSTVSLGADGAVTISGSNIVGVDGLGVGSTWALGNQTEANIGTEHYDFSTIGAAITADDDGIGDKAKALTFTGEATLTVADDGHTTENITIRSAASVAAGAWAATLDSASSSRPNIVFASSGNVTLNNSDNSAITAAFSTVSGGSASVQAATYAGDSLYVGNHGAITAASGSIDVNSVVGGSAIIAKSDVVGIGGTLASAQTWTFTGNNDAGATLVADSVGSAIASASFSGVAQLTAASISGVSVGGKSWTMTGGDTLYLSTVGAATVSTSGVNIAGSEGASLNYATTGTMTLNGATITTDADSNVDFVLESIGAGTGIAAVNNVTGGGAVRGDTLFSVNGTHTLVNNTGTSDQLDFNANGDEAITVLAYESGKNYNVIGGDHVYVTRASVAGVSTNTLNGAIVSLQASTLYSSDYHYASIMGSDGDAITTIYGANLNDTIRTSGDNKFTVLYTDVALDSDTAQVAYINGTQISLTSDDLRNGSSAATLKVDYDGTTSIPYVTLTAVTTSNEATIEATRGIYNLQPGNTSGEIDDPTGYIYIGSDGKTTVEGSSVTEQRANRVAALETLASVGSNDTVPAILTFENINVSVPSEYQDATILHYADSVNGVQSTIASVTGINIYGDTSLSAETLSAVTLQSHIAAPINIVKRESESTNNFLNTAVIDVRNSSNRYVAVGMVGDTIGAINHTIYGSNSASTLMMGTALSGNNAIIAGDAGNYLYHAGTVGVVTMQGGAGADTIAPGNKNDIVYGNGGADVFLDSNDVNDVGYVIQDYDVTQGDVIRATKLSSITAADVDGFINAVAVSGHAISVSGGPGITLGSSENTSVGTNAIIQDATGQKTIRFAWANDEASTVDASEYGNVGAVILSSQNGSAGDWVIGTGGVDTIYAGPSDSIRPGAGNDIVRLRHFSDSDGVMVEIGAGKDVIYGWNFGFNSTSDSTGAGADMIYSADPDAVAFGVNGTTGDLVASVSGGEFTFRYDNSDMAYQLLIGPSADDLQKVLVMKGNINASISSSSDVADRYYNLNAASTLTFGNEVSDVGAITVGGVEYGNAISLGSAKYNNIHKIAVNNAGNTSVIGSSAADTIWIQGENTTNATDHYRKAVSLGGGNDILYSGGKSDSTAGVDIYFGYGAEGNDTVYSFGYYQNDDTYGDGNDLLKLFNWDDSTGGVVGTSDRVDVVVNSSSRLSIARETLGAVNDIIQAQIGNDETSRRNFKVGVTSGTANNSFDYNSAVDNYYGNGNSNRDTINYTGSDDVNIWIANKTNDTVSYTGIGVINAAAVTNAALTLAGGAMNNTIYGGGSGSQSSLWGGGAGNNLLFAGSGEDVFFFGKGASNDTISGATAGSDLVYLYDVALSDIASADFLSDGSVGISLNDGSSLRVTNANGVQFNLGDGSAWTANVSSGQWDSVSAS